MPALADSSNVVKYKLMNLKHSVAVAENYVTNAGNYPSIRPNNTANWSNYASNFVFNAQSAKD